MSQLMAKNFYQACPFHNQFHMDLKVVKSAPKGRYKGIKRNYEVEDLLKLRGSIDIELAIE